MSSIVGRLTPWLLWLRPRRTAVAEESGERAGGSGGESPYTTVYVAGSLPEAHVIKGKLETEDIPVVLRYESGATVFGLVGGGLGSVEVQVPDRWRSERGRCCEKCNRYRMNRRKIERDCRGAGRIPWLQLGYRSMRRLMIC